MAEKRPFDKNISWRLQFPEGGSGGGGGGVYRRSPNTTSFRVEEIKARASEPNPTMKREVDEYTSQASRYYKSGASVSSNYKKNASRVARMKLDAAKGSRNPTDLKTIDKKSSMIEKGRNKKTDRSNYGYSGDKVSREKYVKEQKRFDKASPGLMKKSIEDQRKFDKVYKITEKRLQTKSKKGNLSGRVMANQAKAVKRLNKGKY